MTFKKGNKLASVQKGKPKAKTQAWHNIVGWLIGDGGYRFKEIMVDLSTGKKVTSEEKEFLKHYFGLLEYHQPKLSRKEVQHSGEIDGPVPIIQILNEIESDDNKGK